MGSDVGWVPVDATSFETDYVDSGHIRIGDLRSAATSLNPVGAEILEYRLGDGRIVIPAERAKGVPGDAPGSHAETYRPYLGKYAGPRGTPFTVKVENAALVVDVAGRTALPMLAPDAEGIWRCKLTPDLYVIFDRDDAGTVTTMWIHEVVRMRKTADPAEIGPDVPEALRGHLGTYLLAKINTEFTTAWRDGSLAVRQGDTGQFSRLIEDPQEVATWVSHASGNRFTFQTGAGGKVEGLTLDSASKAVKAP